MLSKLTLVIVAFCFYSSSAMADTALAPAVPSDNSVHKNLHAQPGGKKHSKHITKKQHDKSFCRPRDGERIECRPG